MKRQLILYLFSIFLLTSCLVGSETKTTTIRTGGSIIRNDGSVPVRWGNASIASPLNVKISQDFINEVVAADLDVDGRNPIEQMAIQWNEAVPDRTFFTIPANATTNKSFGSLSSYNDGEMGIYKSYGWFSNVSSTALAIAQFFAVRRNADSANEYLEMIHADIIVNYRDFSFSNDPNSNTEYDLPSVILHEMGHFLGLPHENDYSINSVMLPFLGIFDTNRSIYTADEVALRDNYDGSTLTATSAVKAMTNGIQKENPNEGELVTGYFELQSNGRCQHYINGKMVHSH